MFDDQTFAESTIEDLQQTVAEVLVDESVDEIHNFEHVAGMALTIEDSGALEALASVAGVARIDVAAGGTGTLADVARIVGATASASAGFTGEGLTVAVLDTGADANHPDLAYDLMVDDEQCFGWNGQQPGLGFCPDGIGSSIRGRERCRRVRARHLHSRSDHGDGRGERPRNRFRRHHPAGQGARRLVVRWCLLRLRRDRRGAGAHPRPSRARRRRRESQSRDERTVRW